MKTSDHFIGEPAASLPGKPVLGIPGAGFQAPRGKSVFKCNHLSRLKHARPFCPIGGGSGGANEC